MGGFGLVNTLDLVCGLLLAEELLIDLVANRISARAHRSHMLI
jgi:hypothetical protein